jgi:hypothetical protein
VSRAFGFVLAILSCACEPDLVVGGWNCATSPGAAGPKDDGGVTQPVLDPIALPWNTGFENGFCGYAAVKGFCYKIGDAEPTSVASPVHSGHRAMAFAIAADDGGSGGQTRCVREGAFPHDAYYGAWFYLPSIPKSADNWNLVHFQGGNGDTRWTKLFDVTLVSTGDGQYGLTLNQGEDDQLLGPAKPRAVRVASWFHVVLRFLRSPDANGEVTLYQDDLDQPLVDVTGIVTDPYPYDQWYVGNLVHGAPPTDLTVYVDDVSVSTTR